MLKEYFADKISIQFNRKTGEAGTLDVFKGCPGCELKRLPCYAAKGALRTGINFFSPIRREFDKVHLQKQIENYRPNWVRIGCISDPSLDWDTTVEICKLLQSKNKIPVIVTKLHKPLELRYFNLLKETNSNLQISMSGLAPKLKVNSRLSTMLSARLSGLMVSCRINTAVFLDGSRTKAQQENIINCAQDNNIPILETPIRLFKTSPVWKSVDQDLYHRHLSPISGKLDNQRTAGLIIPGAYPCFSTCAPGPTTLLGGHDEVGCPHQCLTVGVWI